MSSQRQKIQYHQPELAFPTESPGEAPSAGREGTELPVAKREPESPALDGSLMEEVCHRENLLKAWQQVRANKGSPGVDGRTIEATADFLRTQWPIIREQLLQGTYKPQPVRRVEIPKPDGGVRKLGIPTVVDRLIQQAILQVLQKRWDATFSQHSFGFRPNRSAHQAVAQAQKYIAAGYDWVVDIDLEKFFDRVNHDILMSRVAKRVTDKHLLRLIRAFLNAGVMENGLVSSTDEGTPQGGPLSPLLSNLVLDDLDRELERRGHRFCRYADDCNIYVRSRQAGERVMASVTHFLTTRLCLKVNAAKSAVARPWERKFLGFSFIIGKQLWRRIAPQSVDRFKKRVKELTRRRRVGSLREVIEPLARYLEGWRAYYGFCQTPIDLRGLDSWVRRRLRRLVWRRWVRWRTRWRELHRLGVDKIRAMQAASSAAGPWRMANHPAVVEAMPNALFDSLGLPRLAPSRA